MPPSQIRTLKREDWIDALIVPDHSGSSLQESLIGELSDYTELPPDAIRERIPQAGRQLTDTWRSMERIRNEDVQAFYNINEGYLLKIVWWDSELGRVEEKLEILNLALERNLTRLLDFGAGTGSFAIVASQLGLEVALGDISSTMLDYARYRFGRRNLKATFVDLKTQNLDSEAFDIVTAFDVLEHVPPSQLCQTLQQIWHALKPGGLLCAVVATYFGPECPYHLSYPETVRAQLRRAGFKFERTDRHLIIAQKVNAPLGLRVVLGLLDTLYYRARLRVYLARQQFAVQLDANPTLRWLRLNVYHPIKARIQGY